MLVIRRMVDRQQAYTAIFLKGEPAKIFPTTDYEHARILEIYKQDRAHAGILNDFTDFPFHSFFGGVIQSAHHGPKKENPPQVIRGGVA